MSYLWNMCSMLSFLSFNWEFYVLTTHIQCVVPLTALPERRFTRIRTSFGWNESSVVSYRSSVCSSKNSNPNRNERRSRLVFPPNRCLLSDGQHVLTFNSKSEIYWWPLFGIAARFTHNFHVLSKWNRIADDGENTRCSLLLLHMLPITFALRSSIESDSRIRM